MPSKEPRRHELAQLLKLAQTYRGWSRRQLAESLGRDASKLVPESGVPKLDFVVELAKVLDWSVEDVVRALFPDDDGVSAQTEETSLSFDELDKKAVKSHLEGDYVRMVELGRRAYSVGRSGEEKAKACNREAGGWDGQGRYRQALEALRRGIRETSATRGRLLMLRCNLANAHYALWQLYEGCGIAAEIIRSLHDDPDESTVARLVNAFAYYVRGHCCRRLLGTHGTVVAEIAQDAQRDLKRAHDLFNELSAELDDESYLGIARTCAGGVLEVEVALSLRPAEEVVETILESLPAVSDPAHSPVGDWLESYGWWCIFGCNIVHRHVRDEATVQRYMSILTNKADEIAERSGNWAMRERVYAMELVRRQRMGEWSGIASDWTIDDNDVRLIAGTMGRFPEFHAVGWEILRTAKIVPKN